MLINRAMIEAIRPFASDVVEVVASIGAQRTGLEGKVYSSLEEPAAQDSVTIPLRLSRNLQPDLIQVS